jgi:hypothetical protein
MTRLPEIEHELVAAAARRYGRSRRASLIAHRWTSGVRPGRVAVIAMVVLVTLVVAVYSAGTPFDEHEAARPNADADVPAAALRLSRELTRAPAAPPSGRLDAAELHENRIARGQVPVVAQEIQRRIPYPPGRNDTYDWEKRPPDPTGMASLDFRNDVQALIEYRASCIWLDYWLQTQHASATAVLSDIPQWPTFRTGETAKHHEQLAAAARAGTAAPIRREVQANCRFTTA